VQCCLPFLSIFPCHVAVFSLVYDHLGRS
jgi:hypothetical protein